MKIMIECRLGVQAILQHSDRTLHSALNCLRRGTGEHPEPIQRRQVQTTPTDCAVAREGRRLTHLPPHHTSKLDRQRYG